MALLRHERADSACLSLALLAGLLAWGTIGAVPALGLAVFAGGISFLKSRGLTRWVRRAQERESRGP